jgi:hypothetical protein
MKTSESITKIAPALLAAKKAFKPALKTAENPHFKSKYVDLQSVVDATEDALSLNGLMLLQSPESSGEDKMVSVTSRLIHISGEWIEGTVTLPSGTQSRYDAQTVGSAITYARRYSYMGILGIAPEDDDGSTASGSHSVQSPRPVTVAQINRAMHPVKAIISDLQQEAGGEADPLFDENGDIIESKTTVQHREQKAQRKPPTEKLDSAERKAKGYISEAQEKRFIAIAKTNGREWSDIDQYLESLGIAYAYQIPWKKYDDAITWAGGANERRA